MLGYKVLLSGRLVKKLLSRCDDAPKITSQGNAGWLDFRFPAFRKLELGDPCRHHLQLKGLVGLIRPLPIIAGHHCWHNSHRLQPFIATTSSCPARYRRIYTVTTFCFDLSVYSYLYRLDTRKPLAGSLAAMAANKASRLGEEYVPISPLR